MPPSARKRPASASAPHRFLNTEGDGAREGIAYCGYARIRIAPVGGSSCVRVLVDVGILVLVRAEPEGQVPHDVRRPVGD